MFKTRILLVEDNLGDVDLISRMINKCTDLVASVHHLALIEDAKKYLLENLHEVDLILLDLNLPDSDYNNTLHTIVGNFNRIPIIVFTEMGTTIGLRAVEIGAEDYLNKNDLSQDLLEKTILFALKRSQHRNAMKILDQIDPQTNTMREDAFNRLVERCSEIITPDEPYHTINIVFEDIVSLPINTNVIEFIRGFNNYIENIMSSALLGSCYIAKNQTLRVLIQTSEFVNPEKIKHFSRNYIQSSLNRNIPIEVEHRALTPLGGVSY